MSSSDPAATEPRASRPRFPEGYGIPKESDGLLHWPHVASRLEAAQSYWVATVSPSGRPHVRPVWGGYLDDRLYIEGSPDTRWARNIAAGSQVSVHLESATDLVIVEGTAQPHRPQKELGEKLAQMVNRKYGTSGYEPGPAQWDQGGLWLITIRVAYAWTTFPQDVTRFTFPGVS